jgi:hypothetical protein
VLAGRIDLLDRIDSPAWKRGRGEGVGVPKGSDAAAPQKAHAINPQ